MCGNQRVKVLIHYYLRKIVVLWGFKTAHATVTLRETEYSREKSVVTWARYTDTPLLVTSSPHLHTHGHLVFEDDLVDVGEGEHRDPVPCILLGEGFVGPGPGAIPQGRLKPRQ